MTLHAGKSPRQERLLAVIRQYDIGTNPAPEALYSFAVSLLDIWCTPGDHPGGVWEQYPWRHDSMSSLTKPGARGLGTAMLLYAEAAQDIVGFSLQTRVQSLSSHGLIRRDEIENRPKDVAWRSRRGRVG